MSKFVLDSSVALKAVIFEDDSDKAIAVQEAGHELVAPDVFPQEIAHVLTKLSRSRKLSQVQARNCLTDILDARPALKSSMRLLPHAFEISLESRCSFWDALYVALAVQESCPLLTADERLIANLKAKYDVIALSSL